MLAGLLPFMVILGPCFSTAPGKSIVVTWKDQATVLGVAAETTDTFHEDGMGTKVNV